MALLQQGIDKIHPNTKNKVLDLMYRKYIQTDPFDLPEAPNVHYRTPELQAYFTELNIQGRSGDYAKHTVFRRHQYELPDQQTVKDRLQKYKVPTLEKNLNHYLLDKVLDEDYFRPYFLQKGRMISLNRDRPSKRKTSESRKKDKDSKSSATADSVRKSHPRRRKLKKRRKMQRDRNVTRPDGLYLAADPHNIGYYGIEDVDLPDGTNLQSYLIHRQEKNSTITFFQYHVLYSFEQGVRQILGVHLKRRHLDVDGEWQEEPFGSILPYLMQPVMEKMDVKGFVGDGEYYNIDILHFLHLWELDYVIRANWTNELRKWSKENKLKENLQDGQVVEYEPGRTVGVSSESHDTRLVVAKRGTELIPLIVPLYSQLSPEQAFLLYEERFGIETNFRETELRMGFTTAHSPQYRFALFGTACAIYNLVLSYYERVVARSNNPSEWKVTLIELMDILHQFQEDYMVEAVEEASKDEQTDR